MNFLAHLLLAGDDPEFLVGNLMGDFVKGRVEGKFPAAIAAGIMMHRRIDSFADSHDLFLRSRHRLDPAFGLYRGVLVDLFYDHFLAVTWDRYSAVSLPRFLSTTQSIVEHYEALLPDRLRRFYRVIFTDLLPSYQDLGGIDHALERVAARVSRPNPLAGGGAELRAHYGALKEDFAAFFPLLQAYAAILRR